MIALILAMVLGEAAKKLIHSIVEETAYYEKRKIDLVALDETELAMTRERVNSWTVLHMRMLLFCHAVVHFFSAILFLSFGLDVVTLTGFTSSIVKNNRSDAVGYVYLIGSSVIFLSYVTVFSIPLVAVYEKVRTVFYSASNATRIELIKCLLFHLSNCFK